ncbi:hypothetical protein ACOSQ4_013946 [Xanthoceras sorbifolium]
MRLLCHSLSNALLDIKELFARVIIVCLLITIVEAGAGLGKTLEYDIEVEKGWTGFGIVIRNHWGEVLTSSAQRVESAFSALIAEAFGVLRGLVFARDSGLLPAIVESDVLGFVNVVNTAPTLADLSLIVLDIHNILAFYPGSSVMFVPRSTNQAAHCMARFVLSAEEDFFLLEDNPPCLCKPV